MTLYVGARDPEAICIVETSAANDPFDFSTVTSAEITVKNPKKTMLAWSWDVQNKTPTSLQLYHLFSSDGSDAQVAGNYQVTGWLVTARSCRRLKTITLVF